MEINYKIDHGPRLINLIAGQLGIEVQDDGYNYNNSQTWIWQRAYQLTPYLSTYISHFGTHEFFRVKRMGTVDDNLLIIDFHVTEKTSLTLNDKEGPESLMHGSYFASSDVESHADFYDGADHQQVAIIMDKECLKDFFSKDDQKPLTDFFKEHSSFFIYTEIDFDLSKEIYHYFDYLKSPSKFSEKYLLGHTLKVLSLFFERFLSNQKKECSSILIADDVKQLMKVKEYVNAHLEEKISIDNLLEITSMSESKFRKNFKSYFGQSPYDYVKNMKLWYAKVKIEKGESIAQAGYAIGYVNLSYFSKSFKELFGVSPKEYQLNLVR